MDEEEIKVIIFRTKLRFALRYREMDSDELARQLGLKPMDAAARWMTLNHKPRLPDEERLKKCCLILMMKKEYFEIPEMSCEEGDTTLSL